MIIARGIKIRKKIKFKGKDHIEKVRLMSEIYLWERGWGVEDNGWVEDEMNGSQGNGFESEEAISSRKKNMCLGFEKFKFGRGSP